MTIATYELLPQHDQLPFGQTIWQMAQMTDSLIRVLASVAVAGGGKELRDVATESLNNIQGLLEVAAAIIHG